MIYNKYLDNDIDDKAQSVFSAFKKVLSFKNVIFILFALLLSTKTFVGDFRPFNYVILAVASAFEVPLLLVLISSVIGLAVGSSTSSLILLLIFFLLYNLVTAIVNIEGINRKYTIFIKFISSIAILQIYYWSVIYRFILSFIYYSSIWNNVSCFSYWDECYTKYKKWFYLY